MTGYVGYAIQKVVKIQYKTETDSSIYGIYSNVGYFWKWKIFCMAQQLMLISISVPITISQSIDNMGYHMKIELHRNMRLCVCARVILALMFNNHFCLVFFFTSFSSFYSMSFIYCVLHWDGWTFFFAANNNNNVRFSFIWGFKNIDDFVLFPFQTKYFVLFSGLCARVCCCCFFLYCNSTLLQQI